jgi:trehalose 6-phosphate phosphatase
MQVLNPGVDLTAFYETLASARERVLMLDYDGTLAPFKIRREQAHPYPGVTEALARVMRDDGTRVVIISGRRAADVARLLPLDQRPEIWGAHGWECISADGVLRVHEPDAATAGALQEAESLASGLERDGVRLERKPASIALHWRGLPAFSVARVREKALTALEPLTEGGALEWLPFDGGIELRAPGSNKQHAVESVLSATAPGGPVAYLGDDVTDEDAFRAVKGRGLGVLVRAEYRRTAADLWIKPPHELKNFIGRWRRKEAKR